MPAEPDRASQVIDTGLGKVTMHYFSVATNSGNTIHGHVGRLATVPKDSPGDKQSRRQPSGQRKG
jgi:hypothetical protein